MLQNSRVRLLTYYSLIMGAILILFSIALYGLFSNGIYYHQLDTNLETLARLAAPSFARVQSGDEIAPDRDGEFPWQEFFDPERQSLEWFDREGKLLASRGNKLKLGFSPVPSGGFRTLQGKPALDRYRIRTFTLIVSLDRGDLSRPPLLGFVRAGETTEKVQELQKQFLGHLIVSIVLAFGVVGVSGLWLTKKALEPVARSFQQLKQFTADASHELRNPLTVMRTSIDVMRSHPERFQPKDLKKLNAIASATEQMTELTRDLLFLARMDGAKEAPSEEWRRVNLPNLLEDAIEWLEPVASEKKIRLEYSCLAEVCPWGNSSQFSRLFGNLLENAIQYTPSGGRVRLRVFRENQSAVVTVEDTGIGIASEHLSRVFDRFWRADRARAYREGGTGLGLAIVRAIVHQHGGQIHVTSQEGKGSCFRVSLPLANPLHRPREDRRWERVIHHLRSKPMYYARFFARKATLVLFIALLSLLPVGIALETFRQTSMFDGVYFPDRSRSFADEIVVEPGTRVRDPVAVLGIPNSRRSSPLSFLDFRPNDTTLEPGDRITVRFLDNLLTAGGDSRPDLWIFCQGRENTALSVEISKDRRSWESVGQVTPARKGIDLDRPNRGKEDFFAYVRLTYPTNGGTAPIYLDSIGAISSVSLVTTHRIFGYLDISRAIVVSIVPIAVGGIYGGMYWWKVGRCQ
ncbi:HAMP domain-containing sensor histidine kinase [Pannus brasiliensis CCIBt3594]|uniref:histidine kinase n=1 Tax=Pannus brasiliensis CCIBt3594 TaxID=1427578 RepID=A0AAW9QQN3_9CHRO